MTGLIGTGSDRHPIALSLRRILIAAAMLVFLAGLQLFVFTLRTAEWFAWTVGSPMTAVFLGASYWSAIALELGGARASTWEAGRVAIPAVFVFTTLTLGVTLWHIDAFHLGPEFASHTQAVTWGWIAVYGIVPLLLVIAVRQQAGAPSYAARIVRDRLPVAVRWSLVGQAVVMLGLGIALLVAPGDAAVAWPWPLTVLTGRAVGAWLVGLGVGALHARLLDDVVAVRPLFVAGIVFVLLQSVALLRHGGELDWTGLPAVGYVSGLAVIGATSLWAMLPAAAPRDSALPPVTH